MTVFFFLMIKDTEERDFVKIKKVYDGAPEWGGEGDFPIS